ncbi:MAG: cytochrome c biogenesis CcdA family protein [Pseudomonadota bacterium]
MELIFAYAAGLLTLINPCVLPVLPIVLASALGQSRYGPVALAAGMSLSFVAVGVGVTAFGSAIGLDQFVIAQAGAALMIVFGTILLVPAFARRFETATAGFAARADRGIDQVGTDGLRGQFLGGILLGAVWSPCIGPTLGAAISLASQGQSLGYVTLIMSFFALGVSTLILALGLGARGALRARAQSLRGLAERSKPILGATFLTVGVLLLLGVHHMLEAWALEVLPAWLIDLSVAI